jgi:hypothetical protein
MSLPRLLEATAHRLAMLSVHKDLDKVFIGVVLAFLLLSIVLNPSKRQSCMQTDRQTDKHLILAT